MDVIARRVRWHGKKYKTLWSNLSPVSMAIGDSIQFNTKNIEDKFRAQQMAHRIAEKNGIKIATRSNSNGLMIVRIM